MQGKRFVLWFLGVLIVVSVIFVIGNMTLIKSKADVCRGYYDPVQQASCAATATAGPPPNLIKYH